MFVGSLRNVTTKLEDTNKTRNVTICQSILYLCCVLLSIDTSK